MGVLLVWVFFGFFACLFETVSHYVDKDGLELMILLYAGITVVCPVHGSRTSKEHGDTES
jgi:hypothetical protein